MVVWGAMAEIRAAATRKTPAEAARAPDGATQTMTGTGAFKSVATMRRMASMPPPGVSRRTSSRSADTALARSRASSSMSAWAGETAARRSVSRTVTGLAAATPDRAQQQIRKKRSRARTRLAGSEDR